VCVDSIKKAQSSQKVIADVFLLQPTRDQFLISQCVLLLIWRKTIK